MSSIEANRGVVGGNGSDRISESEREVVRGASYGDDHEEVVECKDELGLRMMAESDMFRGMLQEHQESVLTLLSAEQAGVRTVVLAGLGDGSIEAGYGFHERSKCRWR